jgi:hypothetical protein
MRLLSASVLVLGMLGSATCFAGASPDAAMLRNVSGKVRVNTGEGFVPAAPSQLLKAGDSVLLGSNGAASIYFPDANCTAVLPKSMVTMVTGADMCQQALLPDADVAPVITPANSGPPPQGEIPPLFIAGGIVVLSAAALIDGFSHNSSPVSSP